MASYNIIADLTGHPTPKRAEKLLDQLTDYHPAVSPSPHGGTELVLTIEDDLLEVAAVRALRRLQTIAGDPTAYTIMTTEEYDRRTETQPAVTDIELWSTKQVADVLGVTRQRVQQLHAQGRLEAVKLGNSLAFIPAQVEQFRTDGHNTDLET